MSEKGPVIEVRDKFPCPDCGNECVFDTLDDGWLLACEFCGHYVSGPDIEECYDVLCEVLAEPEEVDEDEGDEGEAYDDDEALDDEVDRD